MKKIILFLIILSISACKKEKILDDNILKTEEIKKVANLKSKNLERNLILQNSIIGIWTDGTSENATFEIKRKSIYYVDHFEDYFYKLKNDTIEIKYTDFIYSAKVIFKNDTLIMKSKEHGEAKFWKFEY